MSTVKKDYEIELDNGSTVIVEVEAELEDDPDSNNRMLDSYSFEITESEEELTNEQENELMEKVDELVYETDWNTEIVADVDSEESYE